MITDWVRLTRRLRPGSATPPVRQHYRHLFRPGITEPQRWAKRYIGSTAGDRR